MRTHRGRLNPLAHDVPIVPVLKLGVPIAPVPKLDVPIVPFQKLDVPDRSLLTNTRNSRQSGDEISETL